MAAETLRNNSLSNCDSEGEVNAFSYSGTQESMSRPFPTPVGPAPVVEATLPGRETQGGKPEMTTTAVQRSRILELPTRVRSISSMDSGVHTMVNAYSTIGRVLGFLCRQTSTALGHMQLQFLSLLQEQLHQRDVSSTIMDIVLVVYALGFVALSMYHAAMFKNNGYHG